MNKIDLGCCRIGDTKKEDCIQKNKLYEKINEYFKGKGSLIHNQEGSRPIDISEECNVFHIEGITAVVHKEYDFRFNNSYLRIKLTSDTKQVDNLADRICKLHEGLYKEQ